MKPASPKNRPILKVQLVRKGNYVPVRASAMAAGLDLYAAISAKVPGARVVKNRVCVGRALIPSGIAIELPKNTVGRIASRSGLSVHHNIEVGAGWIDADYRGELMVELKNLNPSDFLVKKKMRIAQLIIIDIKNVVIEVVDTLPQSLRDKGRLASTGYF